MKRYWILTGLLLALFLGVFGILQALHVPFLQDPSDWMSRQGGAAAAAAGIGLLVADVFLPVPSSLLMVAHGALFGILGGTLLSLGGTLGATALGFALGRRGGRLLERLVSPSEKARADDLLRKYGALAILVTRPLPLLAETVSILAGASPMGWGPMLLAAAAGSLPASLLYAITGATARGFGSGALMFAFVLVFAGVFWVVGRKA
ncbi:MAG TPA: VTT domain-containing protein [Fibrobacteria bacterium]|nr:VTT domain-containing protein [Fibrobacteria bacterium]